MLDASTTPLSRHQAVIDRFTATCRADDRVLAAVLLGSDARGTADAHSDLDLSLVITDTAYNDFLADRPGFIRHLGELLFVEDFDLPDVVFAIFADGCELELWLGRESEFHIDAIRPHRVLVDKGFLTRAGTRNRVSLRNPVSDAGRLELLRRQVTWFWHDLSHLITALARDQLWWAAGQLEILRHYCYNLARLQSDFHDPDAGSDPTFKLDQAVAPTVLAPLRDTFVPLERDAMRAAADVLARTFHDLAAPLAAAHEVAYPVELERLLLSRLEGLHPAQEGNLDRQ